ncbi:MAG TPA: hypothetical protein VIS57_01405, partial [Xanthomonadales bacterium]
VRLKVEYIDANGKVSESSQNLSPRLVAGEQTAVSININDIYDANELARRVRVTAVGAQVAEE